MMRCASIGTKLIGAAQQGARDRVRGNFLLLRVAEKGEARGDERRI